MAITMGNVRISDLHEYVTGDTKPKVGAYIRDELLDMAQVFDGYGWGWADQEDIMNTPVDGSFPLRVTISKPEPKPRLAFDYDRFVEGNGIGNMLKNRVNADVVDLEVEFWRDAVTLETKVFAKGRFPTEGPFLIKDYLEHDWKSTVSPERAQQLLERLATKINLLAP